MSNNYAFLSIETGGLDHNFNAVLELVCLFTDENYNLLEEYSSFIHPGELLVESEALKINGITEKDYNTAPSEEQVLCRLNSLMQKYEYPIIAGYGIEFILLFINSMCLRNSIPLASLGLIQDLKQAYNHVMQKRKFRLDSVCEDLSLVPPAKGSSRCKDKCKTYVEIAKAVI